MISLTWLSAGSSEVMHNALGKESQHGTVVDWSTPE